MVDRNLDMLMKISTEGPEVPDVRNSTPELEDKLLQLTNSAKVTKLRSLSV